MFEITNNLSIVKLEMLLWPLGSVRAIPRRAQAPISYRSLDFRTIFFSCSKYAQMVLLKL